MLNTILFIIYLLCVFMLLYGIGWLLIRGNKNRLTYTYILCLICVSIWCMTQISNMLSVNTLQLRVSYAVGNLGICFLGVMWLLFSLFYSGRMMQGRLKKRYILPIFLLPVLQYAAVLTNPMHHLFYTEFSMDGISHGILFWINVSYAYTCVFTGSYMIYKTFKREGGNPFQMTMILSSVLIPIMINILYLTKVIDTSFDITPPAFALSCILVFLATYKYNFLNVNALAFDKAFRNITEGIIIYNKSGKITYVNEAVKSLFPISISTDKHIEDFYRLFHKQDIEALTDRTRDAAELTFVQVRNSPSHYNIKKYNHFASNNTVIASTIIISDVSKYYELIERTRELSISNQQLAIEKERNRIAQEVHDTTGHTLTMIQSLTKLAKIEYHSGDTSNIEAYITQANSLAAGGITELRHSINNLKREASDRPVAQAIKLLADNVKGMEVDVCIQGSDSPKYGHLSSVLYETVRESITNSLRYANASRMDIIVKFQTDSIHLYVFDNGEGCDMIVDGNGLKGIRDRIIAIGGTVRISSRSGEGFSLNIQLPVDHNT